MQTKPYRIDAVLFDFDGTLTAPGALDFREIKGELGCPIDQPVLEWIEGLATEAARSEAHRRLTAFEERGAAASRPNEGAEALLAFLTRSRVPFGIVTRNSRASVNRALANFSQVGWEDFATVITREDPVRPKPSGDAVRLAAKRLGVATDHVLVVGDFDFDMDAGRRAGALTAWLRTPGASPATYDLAVDHLMDLAAVVRMGQPLSGGKLPNDILSKFLEMFRFEDPSVLISAGVGDDTAAVQPDMNDVIVLKSDPITFATDAIGHYAVLVNANDIATAGARPRWFLTTLLLPTGTTASEIRGIMQDLYTLCRRWQITLCGGHTEITDAVNRPVVIGMMAGTVTRARLIDKRRMRVGDRILLTKAVAVEGTALIAREFGADLMAKGIPAEAIERSRALLEQITILPEARIAAECPDVSAMHDVTEGGLATALAELATAGKGQISVQTDQIAIFPETRAICDTLSIDPLGLIGSGSLLICCRPKAVQDLADRLHGAGIQFSRIAEVIAPLSPDDVPVRATCDGRPTPWPQFDVDEITRLF
ncbi:MAG: HAD-IA family hydrolase [Desulfosarcinaceae bacterium]|nr:HAD-IA family hydrolase [Desulfosarcinaceae bacterium]